MYILQYNYSNQGFNNGLNDCELCDGCCSKWQTYSELSPEQFLSALWSVLASFSSPFWRHGSQLNCFGEQTAVFRKRERSEKHSVCLCTRPVPNGKVSDQLVNTEEHLQPKSQIFLSEVGGDQTKAMKRGSTEQSSGRLISAGCTVCRCSQVHGNSVNSENDLTVTLIKDTDNCKK